MELSRGTEDWPNGPDTLKPERCGFIGMVTLQLTNHSIAVKLFKNRMGYFI